MVSSYPKKGEHVTLPSAIPSHNDIRLIEKHNKIAYVAVDLPASACTLSSGCVRWVECGFGVDVEGRERGLIVASTFGAG